MMAQPTGISVRIFNRSNHSKGRQPGCPGAKFIKRLQSVCLLELLC